MTATEHELARLKAFVDQAMMDYHEALQEFHAALAQSEWAECRMADAWCNLVMARWEQARALGIDPHKFAWEE